MKKESLRQLSLIFLQLRLYQAARTINSNKYDYWSWAHSHILEEIVGKIPEVVKEGPLADVDTRVTQPLGEMVETLKTGGS